MQHTLDRAGEVGVELVEQRGQQTAVPTRQVDQECAGFLAELGRFVVALAHQGINHALGVCLGVGGQGVEVFPHQLEELAPLAQSRLGGNELGHTVGDQQIGQVAAGAVIVPQAAQALQKGGLLMVGQPFKLVEDEDEPLTLLGAELLEQAAKPEQRRFPRDFRLAGGMAQAV